jgi:hypothetical protein
MNLSNCGHNIHAYTGYACINMTNSKILSQQCIMSDDINHVLIYMYVLMVEMRL